MNEYLMDKFVDYISYQHELRPSVQALPFPSIDQFKNLILYGPSGVGKYTQMLSIVNRYSSSGLKCEKKIQINTSTPFFIKISDIHYEVDMELLGCNSKQLWDDIYNHVTEIIQNKYTDKHGILVCKNFHKINHELLDIFYSYMQSTLKYIFLSESLSFIPTNILSKCKLLPISRPSKELYKLCTGEYSTDVQNLKTAILHQPEINQSKPLFTKISNYMVTMEFTMSELREDLYSILIFDLGVEKFVSFLLHTLKTSQSQRLSMIKESILFLQYFNNNYRPIYHLEKLVYSFICIIHENK
jgi:replication-associated recombination protein RarA